MCVMSGRGVVWMRCMVYMRCVGVCGGCVVCVVCEVCVCTVRGVSRRTGVDECV